MPTLTKKVFLSSTLIDLKDYRAEAIHACQRVGFQPIYMEDFRPAVADDPDFVGGLSHKDYASVYMASTRQA